MKNVNRYVLKKLTAAAIALGMVLGPILSAMPLTLIASALDSIASAVSESGYSYETSGDTGYYDWDTSGETWGETSWSTDGGTGGEDPVDPPEEGYVYVYLHTSTWTDYSDPSYRYIVWSWKDGDASTSAFYDGDPMDDGRWRFEVPEENDRIIFCALIAGQNDWENVKAQTVDLTVPTDGGHCIIGHVEYVDTLDNRPRYNATWGDACLHNWVKDEERSFAATCLTPGCTLETCSVCREKKSTEVPELAHNYVSDECTECGNRQPVKQITLINDQPQLYVSDFVLVSFSAAGYQFDEIPMTCISENTYVANVPDGAVRFTIMAKNSSGGDISVTNQPVKPCLLVYATGTLGEKHDIDSVTDVCERCGKGSEGTMDKPPQDENGTYQISTANELYWFAGLVNGTLEGVARNSAANAILMSDIYLNQHMANAKTYSDIDWAEWTPIGTAEASYTGTFDGAGYTINGLYFDPNTTLGEVGLFGRNAGTIQNVTLADSYINVNTACVGGLVGRNETAGSLTNCHVRENVWVLSTMATADEYPNNMGGLVALNNGFITRSSNAGMVGNAYADNVGGIAGINNGLGADYGEAAVLQNVYNLGYVFGNEKPGNIGGITGANIIGASIRTSYSYHANRLIAVGSVDANTTLIHVYYYGDESVFTKQYVATREQFASGYVAFQLQIYDDLNHWGQNIGTDPYPTLGGPQVYEGYINCVDRGYTNTENATEPLSDVHKFDDNGFCVQPEHSTAYEPAERLGMTYQIANAGQLYWFAEQVNSGGEETTYYATLVADITVNEGVLDDNGQLVSDTSALRSWTPINANKTVTFYGEGHTIYGLYINLPEGVSGFGYAGLFGTVSANSHVWGVTLKDGYLKGRISGGIAAVLKGGSIYSCHNFNTVGGLVYTGGIVGQINSTSAIVRDCSNTGRVESYFANENPYVGGIVGCIYMDSENVPVECCVNYGTVALPQAYSGRGAYLGGIVGGSNSTNSKSVIGNCLNLGKVDATPNSTENAHIYVGGIAGAINNTQIINCLSMGEVQGNAIIGHVGLNNTILYCYYRSDMSDEYDDTTAVTAEQLALGELAYLLGTQSQWAWGQTIGKDAYPIPGGERVYRVYPTCTSVAYNNEGPDDAELPHAWVKGFCTTEGCGAYQKPVLNLAEGVYEISNAGQLYSFASGHAGSLPVNSARVRLTADIVVNERVIDENGQLVADTESLRLWTPINFYGFQNGNDGRSKLVFDGNGHTISGLYAVSETKNVGFFGSLGSCTVQNLTISDSYFKSFNAAALAVSMSSMYENAPLTVKNCHILENVLVESQVNAAGIAASARYVTLEQCSNAATVRGLVVGGIVGDCSGAVQLIDCLNSGTVESSSTDVGGTVESSSIDVGGLVGKTSAQLTVTYCLSVSGAPFGGNISNTRLGGSHHVYYASDAESDELDATTAMNTKQVVLGETTYRLSDGRADSPWRQSLLVDETPTLNPYYGVVYGGYEGSCTMTYSNSPLPTEPVHSFDDNGFCTACDSGYQPAKLVDGVYEISNAGQLYWFAELVNEKGENYANARLTASITINNDVWSAVQSGDTSGLRSWTPIGSEAMPYAGTFEGDSHLIYGLYLEDDSLPHVGFFGFTSNAHIRSLTLSGGYMAGTQNVGGFVGAAVLTEFKSCYNTNRLDCRGMASDQNIGGIAGQMNACTARLCVNGNHISGNDVKYFKLYVGGIAGWTTGKTRLETCDNSANIAVSDNGTLLEAYIGGIVGYADREVVIIDCLTDFALHTTFDQYVGSVVGYSYGASVKNCLSVTTYTLCRLVGYAASPTSISNNYLQDDTGRFPTAAGVTNVSSAQLSSGEVAYRLINGRYDGSCWWGQIVGGSTRPSLNGNPVYCAYNGCVPVYSNTEDPTLSTEPVHDVNTVYENGFCTACNNHYEPATKDGNRYLIANAGQLYWFAELVNSNPTAMWEAELTADITLNKNVLDADGNLAPGSNLREWTPIGLSASKAVRCIFNGKNHTIYGLYINNRDLPYAGLFGAANLINVLNITLRDGYVYGKEAGALVGSVSGRSGIESSVSNCHNYNTVVGDVTAGGLVGIMYNTNLNISSNAGRVVRSTTGSTPAVAGGLVAQMHQSSTISNSYNTGSVSIGSMAENATVIAGGIVGSMYDTTDIYGCYSTGTVTCDAGEARELGSLVGHLYEGAKVIACYTTVSDTTLLPIGMGATAEAVTGVYYLSNDITTRRGDGTIPATADEFASGKIAYHMNSEGITWWGQTIGTDDYPVFGGTTVYTVTLYSNHNGSMIQCGYEYSNRPYATSDVDMHVYSENGTCTCGAKIPAKVAGYQANAGDTVGFNFYMELDPTIISDPTAKMEITLADGTVQIIENGAFRTETVSVNGEEKTYFVFPITMAPKEMSQDITYRLVCQNGKGSTASVTYSVEDYVNYILEHRTEEDYEPYADVAAAMLRYGYYAQSYFAENGEDLGTLPSFTDESYTMELTDRTIPNSYAATVEDLTKGASEIHYMGMTLLLESELTVRLYFSYDHEPGTEGTVPYSTWIHKQGNVYYVEHADIEPVDWDVFETYSETVVLVTYTPLSYVYNVMNSASAPESLKQLCLALYEYYLAAAAI